MTVQCGDDDLVTRLTRTLFHQCKVVDVFGVRDGMIVNDVRGHKVTHQREAWMHEREM